LLYHVLTLQGAIRDPFAKLRERFPVKLDGSRPGAFGFEGQGE